MLLTITLTGCSFAGSAPSTEPVTRQGIYFDTAVSISLYDYPGSSSEILDECMNLCHHYENLFSSTISGSDVWNINHSNGDPVAVDADTAQLLETAIYYCELSNGQLDITLGEVSSLWNFSKETTTSDHAPPSKEAIDRAIAGTDYRKINIEKIDDAFYVTLKDTDASLELGCVAKGYIADRLYDYLEDKQVRSALINLGGNVKCLGKKPDGTDFTIGIQKPFDNMGESITTVKLNDMSVVSSGVYERYYYYNDRLYHHILNSQTGYPIENGLYSVTIITKSATDADALSTLCFILGPDEGKALIEGLDNTEAIFITNAYEIIRTSGI